MSFEGKMFVLGLIILIDTWIILRNEWKQYEE